METRRTVRTVGAAMLALVVATLSHASTVTVSGTDFDLTYDPTQLGLFGSLNLVGDNLFFTTNNFKAVSSNGAGVQYPVGQTTASGIVLTAHPGFHFGNLGLAEFGDYVLQGASSSVTVTGQLRAFDYYNPFTTQTASTITPSGAMPLNIHSGVSEPWQASAAINSTTPSAAASAWLAGARTVDLTIENLLSAYSATGSGAQSALIEKKFNGVEVSVSPVPLPPSLVLLASGILGALVSGSRRRRGT